MNRRFFLASVPFLPSAVKAALQKPAPQMDYRPFYADSRGIHVLLQDCGRCVEPASLDLDYIFERVYALKKHRESEGLYA